MKKMRLLTDLADLIQRPQANSEITNTDTWRYGAGTYADALYPILLHKKWTHLPLYMIAGMTASLFRFVVDRRLTKESVSAYNWMAENFRCLPISSE